MKSGETKGNILTNREFDVWAQYVDDFNAKYPDQAVPLVPSLVKLYKDGGPLFEMAQTAKNLKNTRSIAAKVQDELIKVWWNIQVAPNLLRLDCGSGLLLTVELLDDQLENLVERLVLEARLERRQQGGRLAGIRCADGIHV